MPHDPVLSLDPSHPNNDLNNHANNNNIRNLGDPEGLDARALNRD